MEREYDSTQVNPPRTLLVAGTDSEELRDDFRSENSRGSNSIERISERLGSDTVTTNRGYFSPTWKMVKVTETLNKRQEREGSHLLQSILIRKNLQRAANQSDPHQVKQLYRSKRFSKTETRLSSQGDYSVKKEIFKALCQARRGRGRDEMVKRTFKTMEREDLLNPPTNSEDWKSTDRLGKVQTKVVHDSTLVARSCMVHVLTNRQQQILYSWRELSDSKPGERDDEKRGHVTI
ncbi:MAG: hypothetical protein EZS28_043710 [Streblomastix strix]|uniref:Uncharacterized protein n=1 Tax=Streblomastix strix TaxID=222440 RepID=A0A5J4TQR1_9EUKA|nr:MAG: hypothetical protein EZS28_043710 [Streblomastix strix]